MTSSSPRHPILCYLLEIPSPEPYVHRKSAPCQEERETINANPFRPEARDGRTKAESAPLDLPEENLVPKKSQGKRKSNYKSLKRGQAKPP